MGPKHQERLGANVNTVIKKGLPPQLKDPASFTVDISVGGTSKEKAMLYLGSGINLLSFFIYKRLLEEEIKGRMKMEIVKDDKNVVEKDINLIMRIDALETEMDEALRWRKN
ncbi:hypothetical protein LWI28_028023 [Acer negundo]|uniref:Uncharacterized protein n=1 Tax=Acer negundo TaxID=4023 RepID=A0AAD5I8G9_ACENE|nr:hypothetical protein LWI28_028023 [Acer negundo]